MMAERLQISPYDPRWVLEFEAERDRIAGALGELARRIEHNGSTAVPGLDAKPIIDIQVSVAHLQPIEAYAVPLAALGLYSRAACRRRVLPVLSSAERMPHTHHVHVVQASGEEERRTLAFRDYLREHSDVARQYAQLKKELAAVTDATDASGREAYSTAKSEFVERVVQIALAAGYPRGFLEI